MNAIRDFIDSGPHRRRLAFGVVRVVGPDDAGPVIKQRGHLGIVLAGHHDYLIATAPEQRVHLVLDQSSPAPWQERLRAAHATRLAGSEQHPYRVVRHRPVPPLVRAGSLRFNSFGSRKTRQALFCSLLNQAVVKLQRATIATEPERNDLGHD